MNFLDPPPAGRVTALLRRALPRGGFARGAACVGLVLACACAIESVRLHDALRACAIAEERRVDAVDRFARSQQRIAALHARVRDLREALEIRRATAHRAVEIARLANALPPVVALTALRRDDGAWHIEGRGTSLREVRGTLGGIATDSSASEMLNLRRDTRGTGMTFDVELVP